MEAVMRAAWSLAQPGQHVPIDGVLDAARSMGLSHCVATRTLENWTAIGAWRPRGAFLELAAETLACDVDEMLTPATGKQRPEGQQTKPI
eukprot:4193263-Lingulodinium_polyedra.AAC.1